MRFNHLSIDEVFKLLTQFNSDLNKFFAQYLQQEYSDLEKERLYYLDIAEIGRFIISNIETKTHIFTNFFVQVELILSNCDTDIENLVVVGLFESLQNSSSGKVDYHTYFDKWLLPVSKDKWNRLIDQWEGQKLTRD
ncbi:DUF7674 family protein [Sediminibacterium ginsengisoli]|uniref:DUF7674 domain-containing protein n=1 Tax=Sediminibacterium ginsengisoli TaxID=413434 RepID=A0A1T4JP68_9BACT|nr:hypothetical protein SAMN04488132_10125 [Sediminibacterium ginsengisoli]